MIAQPWIPPNLWEDGDCWIIGGGTSMPRQFGIPEDVILSVMKGESYPSAYTPYLSALHKEHVIGINNAYQLGSWITFEFFGDFNWYLQHKLYLAEWDGIKVSSATKFGTIRYEGVKYMPKNERKYDGICDVPGMVSWNGNSGIASLSLAYQLGVKRIFLLGFDMKLDENNVSHWHGSHHPDPSKRLTSNPMKRMSAFNRHTKTIPEVVVDARKLGLEILNVNPDSAIEEFPKIKLEQIL